MGSESGKRSYWLIALCTLLCGGPAVASIEYSIADGLSQNSALALTRDDEGFIWIGSEDGLNRFDGYEFRVFHPGEQAGASAGAAYIRDIVAAGPQLFLATEGGGLVVFDRSSERFRAVDARSGLPAEFLTSLLLAKDDELWLGSRNGLLSARWSGDPMRSAMQIEQLPLGDGSRRMEIWELSRGPSGIWIGTGDGLYRGQPDGRISAQPVPGTQTPFNVDSLLEAPAGVLWVGSWDQGLFRVDLSSGQTRRFSPGQADTPGLRSGRILKLAAGTGGVVYIGTDRGLTWYDPLCDCIKALDHRRSARVAGRGFLVQSLLPDERGGLFAGYWGEGLARFTPSDFIFHVEQKRDEGPPGIAHSRVRAMLEDRRGDLWVGTFGGGVQRVRSAARQDGMPWVFEATPLPPGSRAEAMLVWSLLQDRSGRIIAATDDGLYTTDPDTLAWQRERPLGESIPMAGTRTLLEDTEGRLWVGSSAGLSRIDAPGMPRTRVPLTRSDDEDPWYQQQDENIYALYQDAAQRLWVGTWAGLHVLDRDSQPLAHYRVSTGLPGPIIWDIHRHTDGSLWLASNGGLVRVIDPERIQDLRFEASGSLAGMGSGTVYGLASDRQGMLWVTGNRGLTRFDPATRNFDIWRRRDGIASDEFATGALTAGARGTLYFGGIDGLTAIDPSQLHVQAELPQPTLSRAQLGDAPLLLPRSAGSIPSISLRFDHAPLILDFTGFVFDAPSSARYAYRVDANSEFTDLGARRSLSLDRMPVGAHGVELSVDNNGRSATRMLLAVAVAPPYYATWAFRLGVAISVIVGLLLLYGWRVRALTAQRRRLEAEVAARTRELRNQKEALEATAEALAGANSKLKTLSVMDPLTGLPNRRELIERATEALKNRQGTPKLALAVIDLDHFKLINDQHGHQAGDAVLRDFAAVLQSHVRARDSIGRWGGEEFLALLPGTGSEDAHHWAEGLLARVRQRLVADSNISYRISIGIGLAAAGDDMDSLVARADGALYAAKAHGRDRAVVGL